MTDPAPPLALADAASDTRWVAARPLVMFFVTTPDPAGRVKYCVQIVVQALDGGDRRILTPHNAGWAQVSPDGARLASISFPERRLVITNLATGDERTVVSDVTLNRALAAENDLPPTLQWSPDGQSILVQSPEGRNGHAAMRLWEATQGTLLREFQRPEMGPFLFLREGGRVAVPSLARERAAVIIDLDTLAETTLPLTLESNGNGLAVDELHINQTPSLVLHDTAIASDGAVLSARGSTLVLTGRGPERVVVAGKTAMHAPSWAPGGRYAVFEAAGRLYVYDDAGHRLGILGPGEPSPLVLSTKYRPPPRRIRPPGSPFDLAYRTY